TFSRDWSSDVSLPISDAPEDSNSIAAKTMKTKPSPIMITPVAILNMDEASLFLSFLLAQKLATSTQNKMINIALREWNQEAGTAAPMQKGRLNGIVLSVLSRA